MTPVTDRTCPDDRPSLARRYRWPIVVSLVSVVLNVAYLLWWLPVVHGGSAWDTGSDLWGMFRAAHYVGWGFLGGIYAPGNGVVTFPGMAILLSPVALLSSALHLTESYPPFLLPHPTAGLILQPVEMLLACSLLFAAEAVAQRVGVPPRRRVALCVAVGAISWSVTAVWGHAEDAVAVAFALLALSALIDKRWSRAGWLFGVAIVFQPFVLMLLPLALGFSPPAKRLMLLVRAVALSAFLVGVAFVGAPGDTYQAIVEQPTQPSVNHATPWIALAPTLVRPRTYVGVRTVTTRLNGQLRFVNDTSWVHMGSTVAGGPARWIYLAVTIGLGLLVARRRRFVTPPLLIWLAATVLALRCCFESVMTSYYLIPPLIVLLLAAGLRSGRRLGIASAISVATIAFSYLRLSPWVWWTPIVVALAVLLLLTRPLSVDPAEVEADDPLPAVGAYAAIDDTVGDGHGGRPVVGTGATVQVQTSG